MNNDQTAIPSVHVNDLNGRLQAAAIAMSALQMEFLETPAEPPPKRWETPAKRQKRLRKKTNFRPTR